MNKFLILLAAFLVTAASCHIPFISTGTLTVDLRSAKAARTADYGTMVRVQLLANGAPIKVNGGEYYEADIGSASVTFSDLKAGSGYELRVASGNGSGDEFVAIRYGVVSNVTIAAGVENSASVDLTQVSGLKSLNYGGTQAALVLDGTLHFVKDSFLEASDSITDLDAGTLLSGHIDVDSVISHFNSFGTSVASDLVTPIVTLNTDVGLATLDVPNTVEMYNGDGNTIGGMDIRFSSYYSVADSDTGYTYVIEIYSGPGTTLGFRMRSDDPSVDNGDTGWATFDDVTKDADLSSVQDILDKADTLIPAFTVAGDIAYVSSPIGVFILSKDRIVQAAADNKLSDLGQDYVNGDADLTLRVKYQGDSLKIGPVGAVAGVNSGDEGYVVVGTSKGAFASATDPTTGAAASFDLLPGSKGRDIGKVAVTRIASDVYAAAYDKASADLLVYKNGSLVKLYPSFAGVPQGVTDITWWNDGDSAAPLRLVLAGEASTLAVDLAK